MKKVNLSPPTGEGKKEIPQGGCMATISAAVGLSVLIYAIYVLCTL